MSTRRHSLLVSLTLATAGCEAADPAITDEVTLDGDDAKFDAVEDLRVRTGDTSLWVDKYLGRRGSMGAERFVLHGRTSRDITAGSGFGYDAPSGAFFARSQRTLDVEWSLSETESLAGGSSHFVGLSFKPSSGRPDTLTARVVVRPRFTDFTGTGVVLTPELKPVVVGGRIVYRIHGYARSKIGSLLVRVGDSPLTEASLLDDTHFQADLLVDQVRDLAGTASTLTFQVGLADGRHDKGAKLALMVKQLGLTSGDARSVWPPIKCTPSVKSCLAALPDGALDLASCGEAQAVLACRQASGVTVDDAAIAAALATVDTRLADQAGWKSDVSALAGADRADELTAAARTVLADRLRQQRGKWFAGAPARDAALAAEINAGFDEVYARPLDLVPPHEAIPGDLARARQMIADALLLWLADQDLTRTEWGRPYIELVHEYRAQHVASLRNFRENVEPDENGYYIGDWLGAHTEAMIDSDGKVTNFLLEID